MTRDQGKVLLAVLSSAWPNYELTEPTARLWLRELEHCDYGRGEEAVQVLIKTERWFPSIAAFLDEYAATKKPRYHNDFPALEAGDPNITPEQAKTNARRIREALANVCIAPPAGPDPKHVSKYDGRPPLRKTLCGADDHTNCGWDPSGNIPLRSQREKPKPKPIKYDPWALGREIAEAGESA